MIKKILMYKKYYEAWFNLKHCISFKYGFNKDNLDIMERYRELLEYMQLIEYSINKGKEK